MMEHKDTRARILQVALELFTEQGYEATSLREIAERLGVTKAALYYHFKTKEDIAAALLSSFLPALDDLIDWLRRQPRSHAARQEFIRRYSLAIRDADHHKLMRFMERNQTALRDHSKSENARERLMTVIDLMTEPSDPPTIRIKRSMAIFVLHTTWFLLRDEPISDEERRIAALDVALDLLDSADREAEARRDPDVARA